MVHLPRSIVELATSWPAPATMGGVIAIGASFTGEPARALSIALAGAAASIMLARIELRRGRQEIDDLRLQLDHAFTHDGFLDIETGLGTLATLRVDWARQLARYQRRGERFSVAIIDIREEDADGEPGPDVMRGAASTLATVVRTDDAMYRIGPARLAVLLAGSGLEGAAAFIDRAAPILATVDIEGREDPIALSLAVDIVDCREGISPFPEHRLLWDSTHEETASAMAQRWSSRRHVPRPSGDDVTPAA